MTYIEARHKAEDYDLKIRATDPRFNHSVKMMMEDGSFFFWKEAFVIIQDGPKTSWIFVFTEHYRFHVFDADDVRSWEMFERSQIAFTW